MRSRSGLRFSHNPVSQSCEKCKIAQRRENKERTYDQGSVNIEYQHFILRRFEFRHVSQHFPKSRRTKIAVRLVAQ